MSDQLVLVPLGTELLVLTRDELDAARTRARDLGLGVSGGDADSERLVDAEQLAQLTSLPKSWLEEAARQNRIPSIVAGKYRRFSPRAVRAALDNSGDNDRDNHQSQRRHARRAPK